MGNKITRRRPTIEDRYTRPQGLYPHRDVDQRKLRRLILDAKLAPCYPGGEEPAVELEECPICFLNYPSLNRSKCCSKGICTEFYVILKKCVEFVAKFHGDKGEGNLQYAGSVQLSAYECFLQMKSPHATRPTQCPFCKTPNYAVEYRGAKTLEEKGVEQAEEQKVIEAKIRMRQQELQDDEKREQQREEDIREGQILPTPPLLPDGLRLTEDIPSSDRARERGSWRWGNIGRPSPYQTPLQTALGVGAAQQVGEVDREAERLAGACERPRQAVDPDSLWVCGGQRSEVADGIEGLRQATPLQLSNSLASTENQNAAATGSMDAVPVGPGQGPPRVPRYNRRPKGAQGTQVDEHTKTMENKEQPKSQALHKGSTSCRDDEFDLDLEDIMVMEAIWLSIQEQGPRPTYSENEPTLVVPGRLSALMSHLDARQQGVRSELPLAPSEARDQPPGVRGSLRGGLAGAIAAMAERQVASGDATTNSQQSRSILSIADSAGSDWGNQEGEVLDRQPDSQASEPLNVGNEGSQTASLSGWWDGSRWPEPDKLHTSKGDLVSQEYMRGNLRTMAEVVPLGWEREGEPWVPESASGVSEDVNSSGGLSEWVGTTEREICISEYTQERDQNTCGASISEWGGDQSSEQVEVGTSFCSSVPSASELPWEALENSPDLPNGETSGGLEGGKPNMLPESFEEQMMLAMALSLADAQARACWEASDKNCQRTTNPSS